MQITAAMHCAVCIVYVKLRSSQSNLLLIVLEHFVMISRVREHRMRLIPDRFNHIQHFRSNYTR